MKRLEKLMRRRRMRKESEMSGGKEILRGFGYWFFGKSLIV